MRKYALVLLLVLNQIVFAQQELFRFHVNSNDNNYLDCPISIDLNRLSPEFIENLALFEILNGRYIPVNYQIESDNHTFMWFVIDGKFAAGTRKTFVIIRDTLAHQGQQIQVQQTKDELILSYNKSNILNYRISEKMPPEGVDTIYRRSASLPPNILPRISASEDPSVYGVR